MTNKADVQTLKQQVAESSQILDNEGLVDYHGHVSARIPGTDLLLIKPVARPHYSIKPEDVLTVNIEEYAAADVTQWDPTKQKGRTIDSPVPPRETMLHVSIYQARPDVLSVVHTHQLIATAMGVGNTPIKALYNQALPFAPETPIFPKPNLISNIALGREAAACLSDRNAMLMRGHGAVVVGESVEHAVGNTIYLERTALMQVIASIVGSPTALSSEYVAEFGPDWNRRASHAYEYFRSLVPSLGGKRRIE